jgi:DNA polymerase III psi subunit
VNWDPWQREVLEALGHTVYRMAPAESSVAHAQKSAPVEDALLRALLRAAAHDVAADDAAALLRTWPPAAQLRGNPAAKRALWPRLRALRARGATP